jgi:hypothetical protein
MKNLSANTLMYMRPDAVTYAQAHPTALFGKHPIKKGRHTTHHHIDYRLLSQLGKIHTKGQWQALITEYVTEWHMTGSKGGDAPEVTAGRVVNALKREGILTVVGV